MARVASREAARRRREAGKNGETHLVPGARSHAEMEGAAIHRLGLALPREIDVEFDFDPQHRGRVRVSGADLYAFLEEQASTRALRAAVDANPFDASPELAMSVQGEKNWWDRLEQEFGTLNSKEVAQLLGASPSNRNYASSLRGAGKVLGFKRGNAVKFPRFQFDTRQPAVLTVIPKLIDVARRHNVPDEDLLLWMVGPSRFFAEQDRPVDHLQDPDTLLAAARDEFGAVW